MRQLTKALASPPAAGALFGGRLSEKEEPARPLHIKHLAFLLRLALAYYSSLYLDASLTLQFSGVFGAFGQLSRPNDADSGEDRRGAARAPRPRRHHRRRL